MEMMRGSNGVLRALIGRTGDRLRQGRGQMTIEFVAVFPVALAIALAATNALLFLSDCASFDRVARNAVRVCATSPAVGMGTANCQAAVQGSLDGAFSQDYLSCSVAVESRANGLMCYTATLRYRPNIFGMGFRSEFFGVHVPEAVHSCSLTVDPYQPGVIF